MCFGAFALYRSKRDRDNKSSSSVPSDKDPSTTPTAAKPKVGLPTLAIAQKQKKKIVEPTGVSINKLPGMRSM